MKHRIRTRIRRPVLDAGARRLVACAAAALLIVGCADSTSSLDSSTTTVRVPTTAEPSTTTSIEETTTTAGEQSISVYFSVDGDDCAAVEEFERSGPSDADPVELALTELLAGPTPEEQSTGAGSFFSAGTADALWGLDLTEGLLGVEFRDIRFLNNASTSCGSQALLSSLSSTVLQFPEVDRVRFTIWGSCSLFWNWLQAECSEVTREGTIPTPVDVSSLAEGSGCTPGPGDLPDGIWFGYVSNPTTEALDFDLACWFSGAGAIEATLDDGEESPPPNDYYIRNTSTETRAVSVSSGVDVRWLAPDDIVNPAGIDYADWIDIGFERDWVPGVWIEVRGGVVISIEEQYQP